MTDLTGHICLGSEGKSEMFGRKHTQTLNDVAFAIGCT